MFYSDLFTEDETDKSIESISQYLKNDNIITRKLIDEWGYDSKILKLYFSKHKIQNIEQNAFHSTLTVLDLSNNHIKCIDLKTFGNLFNLRSLNLASNKLEIISKLIFLF